MTEWQRAKINFRWAIAITLMALASKILAKADPSPEYLIKLWELGQLGHKEFERINP